MSKRETLLQNLIDTFKNDKNTFKIVVYGSDAKKTSDKYSDIDIVIYNSDISRMEDLWKSLISNIGTIRNYFYFIDKVENQVSPLFWLKEYSPYTRVDLAIVPSEDSYGENFPYKPSKVVFEDLSRVEEITFKKVRPIKDTNYYLNLAINNLVGFLKQKQRKEKGFFNYWKLNVLDYLIFFLKESNQGYPEKEELDSLKVNHSEIKHLMNNLNHDQKELLNKIMPDSLIVDFNESFYLGFELLIELLEKRARNYNSFFDEESAYFYLDFFKKESGVSTNTK